MKTPSDELFKLIKSLTASEKKYVVNKLRIGKENKYRLKLFNIINAQKVSYNEFKTKKRLGNSSIIKNFKHLKSRLAQTILNKITEYNSGSNIDAVLHAEILKADFLYEKRLPDYGNRILSKTETIALQYENFEFLLMIIKLKAKYFTMYSDKKIPEESISIRGLSENDILKKIDNKIKFRNLALQLRDALHKFGADELEEKGKKLFVNSLLKSEKCAITFSSLRNYYFIHFIRCKKDANPQGSYDYQKKWVDYLENNTDKWLHLPGLYLEDLSLLLISQFEAKKVIDIDKTYQTALNFYAGLDDKKKTIPVREACANLIGNYLEGKQKLYIQPQNTIRQFAEINRILPFEKLTDKAKLSTCLILFTNYFYIGAFRQAVKWLNKIVAYNKTERTDIQTEARILLLIIHYELGNIDILERMANQGLKWLNEKNALGAYELLILDSLGKKLPANYHNDKGIATLDNLFKKLQKYDAAKQEFDLHSWILSKLKNKPFIEIIRDKLEKANGVNKCR